MHTILFKLYRCVPESVQAAQYSFLEFKIDIIEIIGINYKIISRPIKYLSRQHLKIVRKLLFHRRHSKWNAIRRLPSQRYDVKTKTLKEVRMAKFP